MNEYSFVNNLYVSTCGVDNVVFYLLLMLIFMNKINSYITFILFNPLVYVVFALFRILVVLCFFTSNLYYECVK